MIRYRLYAFVSPICRPSLRSRPSYFFSISACTEIGSGLGFGLGLVVGLVVGDAVGLGEADGDGGSVVGGAVVAAGVGAVCSAGFAVQPARASAMINSPEPTSRVIGPILPARSQLIREASHGAAATSA